MGVEKSVKGENSVSGTLSVRVPLEPSYHSEHEVQFYYDDRVLIHSLLELLGTALASGSSAIVVATKAHRDQLVRELEAAGFDLDAFAHQGRYIALDSSQALSEFTRDGRLDESRFRDLFGGMIESASAMARGNGDRVVAFGEMVAVLWARGQVEAALELEQFWNRLLRSHSFHLRCAYPIASFDHHGHIDFFVKICGEHQLVIPGEGGACLVSESDPGRGLAQMQQAEQVAKAEIVERHIAEARTREVQSENRQLANEIRRRDVVEGELRRFTRRLLAARDEEQRRIAAELHENTAQLLAALSLYFGVLRDEKASLNPRLASAVASSQIVSENLLSEIRKLAHLLHPPTLDAIGLSSALAEYIEQFQLSSGAKVTLEIDGNLGRFDRKLEITVFRIVEEALDNLYPQAQGAFAVVRLARSPGALNVQIQQHPSASGDPATPCETYLTGIHERVIEHGGTVQFTSNPSGMLILVMLPVSTATETGNPP